MHVSLHPRLIAITHAGADVIVCTWYGHACEVLQRGREGKEATESADRLPTILLRERERERERERGGGGQIALNLRGLPYSKAFPEPLQRCSLFCFGSSHGWSRS